MKAITHYLVVKLLNGKSRIFSEAYSMTEITNARKNQSTFSEAEEKKNGDTKQVPSNTF